MSAGVVTATGNITGAYILGNGSQLTGLPASYSNANVAAYLPTYSGNIGNLTVVGNLSVTGNVTITNTEIVNQTITTVGNITGGNILTGGQISSTGNITTANTVVAAIVSGTTTVNSANGNFGNITVGAVGVGATGNISANGNIAGNYFIGNGSALTGMYSNTTVTNYLSGGTYSGDINAPSGVVTAAAVNSTGAVTASSYVQAAGGIYSISTYGGTYSDGIVVDYVTGQGRISMGAGDGFAIFNSGVGGVNLVTVSSTGNVSVLGNVSAPYFIGNGSQLTGLAATYSNANVAAYLPTYSGDLGAVVNITASGNVTGATVTATGNLSGVSVLGTTISAAGNITGGNLTTTGVLSFNSTGNVPNIYLGSSGNLFITSNSTSATRLRMIGSANNSGANGVTASFYQFANTSNTTILQLVTSNTEMRINSSAFGNVSPVPFNFYIGNALSGGFDTSTNFSVVGNISAGNITGPNASTSVALVNYKDTPTVLTYASTITPNIALGSIQTVTLTGNVTFNAYGGTPQAGQSLTLIVLQDSTGNRLLTSTMKFAGGAKTLSTAANAADIIYSFYDGTNYYATLSRAYQ